MKSVPALFVLAASLSLGACHSEPAPSNVARAEAAATEIVTKVIEFQHQNAMAAANHARTEFGRPPMEAEVRVECSGTTNAWVVKATRADLARVEAIAARYDVSGEAPWTKGR